jgi:signal transduction histidine kinase
MKSLRSRLTFTHALIALVAVSIVAILATVLIRVAFDRFAPQTDADNLAAVLSEGYQRNDGWAGLERRIKQADRDPLFDQSRLAQLIRRQRVQIFDDRGALVFDSAPPGQRRLVPNILRGVQSAIEVDGRSVGLVVVSGQRAALSPAERSFLGLVYVSVGVGSVLAVLIALAVGLVITGRVTRPLRSLTGAARRLASGERHEPLSAPPDRELAELATAFNAMASDLERQQSLRRQLVGDIAHELRTPLSVLRMQIEGLEDGVEQPTPETLHSLAEEVGLLTRLVDDLRLLSLADAGQISLAIDVLDAGTAAERAVAAAQPRARQQSIDLRAEPTATSLMACADPQRLAQILGNLIENALRYTPAGGSVAVRIRSGTEDDRRTTNDERRTTNDQNKPPSFIPQSSSFILFEVADTGAGIPPDELPYIFERFYRTDKARARETGGTGLGLAIVQRLVEMQGGHIWAESTVGRGTAFFVALPARSPRAPSAPGTC